MKDYLKEYHVSLRTVGPVFIGSGRKIGKKEYIMQGQQVTILDLPHLYESMVQEGLENNFEDFMMNTQGSIAEWLKANQISKKIIGNCVRYKLMGNDYVREGNSKLEIYEFMKDPFMRPYVPGSSLKGMLRTILLADKIGTSPNMFQSNKKDILENVRSSQEKKSELLKDAKNLEQGAFNTLGRNKKRNGDAVNDVMSGIIVSDSEPLDWSDLTLCQKTGFHVDGTKKSLNMLRESIAPGKEINFTITIDTLVCPDIDADRLLAAVKKFADTYYDNFISAYHGANAFDRPTDNSVWLGGGAGFVTKTVVYPLFGKEEGLQLTQDLLQKMFRNHKHENDKKCGVSPRTIKCMKLQNHMLQMGLCNITIR